MEDLPQELDEHLPDPKTVRRVRTVAAVSVVVQVGLATAILWEFGPLYRDRFWWIALVAGVGAFEGIRLFLRAPRMGRVNPRRPTAELIAGAGVDLTALPDDLTPAAVRLEVQDALDQVRLQAGSRRMRVVGRVAFGLGTLGWSVATVVTAVGHDFASTAVCAVAAAAFGTGGWLLLRGQRRSRRAEEILEEQLEALTEGSEAP